MEKKEKKKRAASEPKSLLMLKKETKGTVFPHELIGEEILVVSSTNRNNIGLRGRIVDETKSTIKVQKQKSVKTLLKQNIVFCLVRTGQLLEGSYLKKRPEERIKG